MNDSSINEGVKELFEISKGMYFRRDGTPYKTIYEWAADFEKANELRRVAETKLWWGGYVSTVWLGLNHNYFGGPPLIFETMVFGLRGMNDLDMERYSTEAEAFEGHARMVKAWRFPFIKLIQAAYYYIRQKIR